MRRISATIFLLSILALASSTMAQGTEISYQGQLQSSSAPANGNFDFEFALFDSGGSQIGSTIMRNGVSVTSGIFSVTLDFGAGFPGATRFLEIRVRQAGGGAFTTLTPRQPVTSTPYSIKSLAADNTSSLGGVAASQYLQTNGSGSGLTNLNASSITAGTLSNARIGQIATANIADSAVTSSKIAGGQVVKNVNGLTDNVTLAAGANISITPSGNTLTIASTGGGGGVTGSGTAGQVALWTGASTLGVAQISQSGGNIGIATTGAPTDRLTVQTATSNYGVVHTDGAIAVGSFIGGSTNGGWYGTRSNHPLSFFTNNNPASLTIATNGNVGIGLNNPSSKLHVTGSAPTASSILGVSTGSSGIGVYGISSLGTGVLGEGSGSSDGVAGQTTSGTGVVGFSSFGRGVEAEVIGQGAIALKTSGTSFFKGDTTPLSPANAGSGTGVVIGSAGSLGYISAYDYSTNQVGVLLLNNSGGLVGIGTNSPAHTLSVNGTAGKPGGGSWATFSDERLKNIKGRFNDGLKAVMKLQPLRYEYKKDNLAGVRSDGEHIGFSAQQVEKIIPEAVTKTEQGIRLVNNDPIIFAMLNAIKEQQMTIEKLSRKVRSLERANAMKKRK